MAKTTKKNVEQVISLDSMKSAIMAARGKGNNYAISYTFASEHGAGKEEYDSFKRYELRLFNLLEKHASEVRACIAGKIEEKEISDVDSIWNEWRTLCHALTSDSSRLHVTANDIEILWDCIERKEKNKDGEWVIGIEKPSTFRKKLEREIGFRLAHLESLSAVEIEWQTKKLQMERMVNSAESKRDGALLQLVKLEEALIYLEGASDTVKEYVLSEHKKAKSTYEEAEKSFREKRADFRRFKAAGIDGVDIEISLERTAPAEAKKPAAKKPVAKKPEEAKPEAKPEEAKPEAK